MDCRAIVIGSFFVWLWGSVLGQQNDISPALQEAFREEIIALGGQQAVTDGMAFVQGDSDRTNREHIALTEVEAPPFQEGKRAALFAELLLEAGVDTVWIDSAGNVLGLRKGVTRRGTVALDAHLDTVFPEGTDVTVRMRGDTMYAPGIGDDTRGLALVLSVARAMSAGQIETGHDVLFVGSVGEEGLGDLRGVKHLFGGQNGHDITSWISVDGGTIGRVNNKGLGSHRYRVTFNGAGGHSWGAFGLANPHHAMGMAIGYFVAEADEFTRQGPRTSYNVGRIGGGTSINSIPFSSWMEVDMRSESPEMLAAMDEILERAVYRALNEQNAMSRLGDTLTVELTMIGQRPSGEMPDETPIVQRAMAATAYMGKRPVLTTGSTNANIPIALGIPAVTIGRGGKGANAHSLDEWWLDDEGYKAAQLALLLLVAESGLAD